MYDIRLINRIILGIIVIIVMRLVCRWRDEGNCFYGNCFMVIIEKYDNLIRKKIVFFFVRIDVLFYLNY